MRRRTISRQRPWGILNVLVLVLLVLYLAGTSQFETLHAFVHGHDQVEAHTAEEEADPCHRLIYHDDVAKGCGHASHLIASDRCEMCDLVCHSDQCLVDDIFLRESQPSETYLNSYEQNPNTCWCAAASSRAPPCA